MLYVFVAFVIFIATNIVALIASGFIYAFIEYGDVSEYVLPPSISYNFYVLIQLLLALFSFIALNISLSGRSVLRLRFILPVLVCVTLIYYLIQAFLCSIDVFFGCSNEEIFSLTGFLSFLYLKVSPAFVGFLVVFGLKNKNIYLKVLFTLFLVVMMSIGPLFSASKTVELLSKLTDDELPLFMKKDLDSVTFNNFIFSDSGYRLQIPDSHTSSHEIRKWIPSEYYGNNRLSYEYQFDHFYLGTFSEDGENTIFVNIYNFRTPQKDKDISEFINYCGADFKALDRRDFSEFCPSGSLIKTLPNGVQYCETLNKNSQLIIDKAPDPLSRRRGNVIENRERVFIAKYPDDSSSCFYVKFYAEPKNTIPENLVRVAEEILGSISTN